MSTVTEFCWNLFIWCVYCICPYYVYFLTHFRSLTIKNQPSFEVWIEIQIPWKQLECNLIPVTLTWYTFVTTICKRKATYFWLTLVSWKKYLYWSEWLLCCIVGEEDKWIIQSSTSISHCITSSHEQFQCSSERHRSNPEAQHYPKVRHNTPAQIRYDRDAQVPWPTCTTRNPAPPTCQTHMGGIKKSHFLRIALFF